MRKLLVLAAVALAIPATAQADKVFHTLHAELVPVNGAPLRSGFVNDIHTNGVVNAAHERYQLNGALANTTYSVQILVYLFDTTCSTAPIVIRTATLTTNGAGNAEGGADFPAAPSGPLAGAAHGIRWQVLGPIGVAYQTGCETVTVD
jgi:hypothetical protein